MANTALARFTAGVTFIAGQLATFTDFRRIQNAIRQNTMEALFGRLFLNGTTLRDGFFGNDCLVSSSGGLNYSVAAGLGFMYDSTVTDEFTAQYRPIVVPSAITGALGAHDASNPRIDIICLAPAFTADTNESITVRASDGTLTTPTADRRSLYYRAIQVVAGTPAGSPSAPATPSGYMKIAECAVPAVSGDIVVTDSRTVMVMSQGALGPLSIATANLQASAVTAAKIAADTITAAKMYYINKPQYVAMTVSAEGTPAANKITVDIQVTDGDGNALDAPKTIELVIKSANGAVFTGSDYAITIGSTGTEVVETNDVGSGAYPYMLLTTDIHGVAQVIVEDIVTGANRGVRLFAKVMGTVSIDKYVQLPFN